MSVKGATGKPAGHVSEDVFNN